MKKITSLIFVFFLIGYLFFKPDFASSEPAAPEIKDNPDTGTLAKDTTPLAKIKRAMAGVIKYIPSGDNIILSESDDIYTYYSYEHDKTGRTTEKRCYNVGADEIQYTSDDTLKYYLVYEYDKKGKLIGDVCYNGIGADNKWFTSDDLETYHSAYQYDSSGNKLRVIKYSKDGVVFDYTALETDAQGAIVKDVVYKNKGADDQWFTKDDEIEKYHHFKYDNDGNLLRAMEYHVKQNGKGQDNAWFTSDDVISSTKVFVYSSKGLLVNIEKYIGSGPDNQWFTSDDVPQYYTVYTYTEKAYPGDEIDKMKP
jgi:hypothetical protein